MSDKSEIDRLMPWTSDVYAYHQISRSAAHEVLGAASKDRLSNLAHAIERQIVTWLIEEQAFQTALNEETK